jgi:hypothetical protein
MFDYINRKKDPIAVIFYCGLIPFGLFWVLRRSLIAGFAFEAYFATMAAFVYGPFEIHNQIHNFREPWFWKSLLLAGGLVHPLFLIGLWYLDRTYPVFVTGTGTLGLVGFVVGVVEMVAVGEIVDRFRPPEQEGRPSLPPQSD